MVRVVCACVLLLFGLRWLEAYEQSLACLFKWNDTVPASLAARCVVRRIMHGRRRPAATGPGRRRSASSSAAAEYASGIQIAWLQVRVNSTVFYECNQGLGRFYVYNTARIGLARRCDVCFLLLLLPPTQPPDYAEYKRRGLWKGPRTLTRWWPLSLSLFVEFLSFFHPRPLGHFGNVTWRNTKNRLESVYMSR